MKIMCLGDSPFINTGFGVVNKVATSFLLSQGHEVIVIGGQDTSQREYPGMTFIPIESNNADAMGLTLAGVVADKYKPDAVHIIGDPTSVQLWLRWEQIRSLPVVAYMPVEGAPLNKQWTRVFADTERLRLITCSYYGQNLLAESGFESMMAYHGVSSDFQEYPSDVRAVLRDSVGWEDKFIVLCVAQNVRRKGWPRLFEAIKLLTKRYPDIYLYAHTIPFNNHWLGGHDLPQLAEQMGIDNRVIFNGLDLQTHNQSIPLFGANNKPGLIDFYNMSDVFVLPSQVEGFGLPLAEAMACGLPVITTDYAAQAEVVGSAGLKVPVHDWEWNQAHARYANLHPRDIASAIEKVHNSQEVRSSMRRKSLERAKAFNWNDYRLALREAFDAIANDGLQASASLNSVQV